MTGWQQVANEAIDAYGALHNRRELSALLALADDYKPFTVLEIGTYEGGSAWAFDQLPSVDRIVSIDLYPEVRKASTVSRLSSWSTFMVGNSHHESMLARVKTELGQIQPDLVFIDGDHVYEGASQDWLMYGPLVRPGGLIVLHDTQGYPGNEWVQVPKLWEEITATHATLELVQVPGGPGGTGVVFSGQ